MAILSLIDTILFILLAISVVYLLVFAFASMFPRKDSYPAAKVKHRFAVLFPAYREDKVIEGAVRTFLEQDYPRDKYEIFVISDGMSEETNKKLEQLPVRLLRARFKESSKARALNLAVDEIEKSRTEFGMVLILDADNTADPDLLSRFNDAYDCGAMAVQAHRVARNRNTPTAVLDAASEEINNSIFRSGHVRIGFSSALIGSGMAFDYGWFRDNVRHLATAGEDKELEVLLLSQRIYIEFLDNVKVYDEKTSESKAFYGQRRRWLATQFGSLGRSVGQLPGAVFSGNWDYADKLFQWMLLPRILLLGAIACLAVATPFVSWMWAIKWWFLLFFMALALAFALPDYLADKSLGRALRRVPLLAAMMTLNLFRLRGADKKFIHTAHEGHE